MEAVQVLELGQLEAEWRGVQEIWLQVDESGVENLTLLVISLLGTVFGLDHVWVQDGHVTGDEDGPYVDADTGEEYTMPIYFEVAVGHHKGLFDGNIEPDFRDVLYRLNRRGKGLFVSDTDMPGKPTASDGVRSLYVSIRELMQDTKDMGEETAKPTAVEATA